MNREEILNRIDQNNKEIASLVRQLKRAYDKDKELANQLLSLEPPLKYMTASEYSSSWKR